MDGDFQTERPLLVEILPFGSPVDESSATVVVQWPPGLTPAYRISTTLEASA